MNIEIENRGLAFFRLSTQQDLILFLIKKELQGAKFTSELDRIGFDVSTYCPDLGAVILSLVGFSKRSDELWEWYHDTLDSFTTRMELWDSNHIGALAFDFYSELRAKMRSESVEEG